MGCLWLKKSWIWALTDFDMIIYTYLYGYPYCIYLCVSLRIDTYMFVYVFVVGIQDLCFEYLPLVPFMNMQLQNPICPCLAVIPSAGLGLGVSLFFLHWTNSTVRVKNEVRGKSDWQRLWIDVLLHDLLLFVITPWKINMVHLQPSPI